MLLYHTIKAINLTYSRFSVHFRTKFRCLPIAFLFLHEKWPSEVFSKGSFDFTTVFDYLQIRLIVFRYLFYWLFTRTIVDHFLLSHTLLNLGRPRYFVLFLNSPIKIVIRSWIYEDSIELLFEVFIVYSKMYWNVKWNVCSGMWNILNIIRKQKKTSFLVWNEFIFPKKKSKIPNQGKER